MSDRRHPRRQRRLSAGDVRELARINGWQFSPADGTPPASQAGPVAAGRSDIGR